MGLEPVRPAEGVSPRSPDGPTARTRLLQIVVMLLLAGLLPWLLSEAAQAFFGTTPRMQEPLHEAVELVGSCIAMGVAILLLLRSRHEEARPHLLWVLAALVVMGLLDAVHAILPFGLAWSWLRHGATLLGGVLFGLIWLSLPEPLVRRKQLFASLAALAGIAIALGIWWWEGSLPQPWVAEDYTGLVKLLNGLGGLGFLAATFYFSLRYLREAHTEDIVFASHTLLFGTAGLLFGFSHLWAADWWVWHGLRLVAYAVVLIAAYEYLTVLYSIRARYTHELEERVRARTADLQAATTVAEQARKVAEEASRAKDHFLAVLSHELRTPLTPVLTTAEMLSRDPAFPEQYREDTAMIRRNAELEARLIDDLLDVTRITRGKLELDRRPVDLRQVIRQAVEVCQPDIEGRQLRFSARLDSGPRMVLADPARLQQVFWNLLKNAVKFTPHGGCLDVRCTSEDGHVLVTVQDSGEGIDPALLPHIFKPFEQGGRETTRQFGGLGLGLTITKGLVEMHGGTIEARSAGKGKGATFIVRLPLLRPAEQTQVHGAPPARAAETAASGSGPRSSLRILLVEDHDDTARIMRRLLMADGHQVQTTGDVATTLELIDHDGGFDLLISDLGLPDASGVDLLRQLRRQGCTIPAIALSGFGQEGDIRNTQEAGFAAHLTKPTTPDRLAATIADVVAQRSAGNNS